MTRQAWGIVAFLLSALVLVCAGITLSGLMKSSRARSIEVGPSVEGSVATLSERPRLVGGPEVLVLYQYDIGDGIRRTGEAIVPRKRMGEYESGTPVTVHYLSKKPHVSRMVGDGERASGNRRALVGLILLVFFAIPDFYILRGLWAERARW